MSQRSEEMEGRKKKKEEEEEGEETETRKQPRRGRGRARLTRLTERDRNVCALVAQARWLTAEQLERAAFPGRHQRNVEKRLAQLVGTPGPGWHALLERHRWVTPEGMRLVWGLTEAGYAEAGQYLDLELAPPPDGFAPETMAHHVALTELYVGLLATPLEAALARVPAGLSHNQRQQALAGVYARAHHPAWRWTVVGDGVHLPWRVYAGGRSRDKVMRPDAVLELPGQRRRLFLECEMGTHTVVPRFGDNKPNSTMAKLSRWNSYVGAVADGHSRRTWYQLRYPDGYAPEVCFLVHSERRAASVAAAIEAWRKSKDGQVHLSARALTLAQALAELLPLVGASAPPGPAPEPLRLTPEEARTLVAFFQSAREDLKRRQALAVPAQAPGMPAQAPVVPAGYEAMKALARRLQALEGAR